MIRTTTNFNTYNALTTKKPVWIIQFDGISDPIFCSQTFSGITSAYNKLIKSVDILGAKVDPINFKYDYSGYDFEIIDKDNEVTGIFASYNLLNRKITVKLGFQELTTADFLNFPAAYITDYQFDNGVYKFSARDTLYWLEKPIFQSIPETYLTAELPIADGLETLTNPNLTAGTSWSATGDFSLAGDAAAYSHSAGSGTLTQTRATLNKEGEGNKTYKFTYTLSGVSGTFSINITTSFALTTKVLTLTAGTHSVYFCSAENPEDFIISATSSSGGFTLDSFSLKEENSIALVNSITGFTAAGGATWGENTNTYLKIDNEIVEYTASTTGQFTITRAQLGTNAQEHSKGAKVTEVYYVFTNPYRFFLQILQTSAAGGGGTYDLTLTGWGLSAGSFTDETQIKNDFERYKFSTSESTDRQGWVITKKEDSALNFIIENILKVIPAYLIASEEGKIGIKWMDLRVEWFDTFDLNNSSDHQIRVLSNNIISHIQMYRQYDGGSGDWVDIDEITTSVITDVYGTKQKLIIKPYIYSGLATVLNTTILQSIFMRYGNPPIEIKLKAMSSEMLMEISDVVKVTNANLPLFTNGTKGWAHGCEITANNIICDNNFDVNYTLMNYALHKRSNLFSTHFYEEASITDPNLTLNATGSDVLQTDDAYIDTGLTSLDHYVVCTIQATLPGGSAGEENITLELRIQHTDTTNTDMQEKRIYYDSSKSGIMQWELMVHRVTPLAQTQRIKVDWTAESAGAGDKLTNVKFIACKVIQYGVTSYTTTDIK